MNERPKPRVAGIRFRNAGRILYFDTRGMRLDAGEFVVVETVRGPELGRVVIAPDQVVVDHLGQDLKPILRLATEADIRKMDGLRKRATDLLPEARRLAVEAGFPARIDEAEFTLDGRRLTFAFAAEDRLEYRELLRRIGDRFGAKVDMRQMGARDRAKLAGGYGVCGRELCCSNWLTTFPSISIRMAKEQDLPLNPQKISGLCGRLLCCLSYEELGYKEMRKTLPKLGQRCSTPTGEGKVISVNILRRQVSLIVDGQRIEVGDRDLGTVVRWDTASKIGTPPPSLTRAEAIAQGLIVAGEEEPAEMEEDREPDWMTNPRPSVAGGRLPNRPARPQPARAAASAPAAEPAARSGRQVPARSGSPAPAARSGPAQRAPREQPPRGEREPAPAPRPGPPPARSGPPASRPTGPPDAKARTFQRRGDPPPGWSPRPGAEPSPQARGRRGRGRPEGPPGQVPDDSGPPD